MKNATTAATRPDVMRFELGGPTIEDYDPGVARWWVTNTTPAALLSDPQMSFTPTGNWKRAFDDRGITTDWVDAIDCGNESTSTGYCGILAEGQTEFPNDRRPRESWFWTAPGTYDVTITAQRLRPNGTLANLCTWTRTYQSLPPNADDPDRQAVDYYVAGGFFPGGQYVPKSHAEWHDSRDKQRYFMGDDWLIFHRLFVKGFDDWRAFFGYPPVTAWDGSTPVPQRDGGLTMADLTRPDTLTGKFHPDCYGDGSGCAPPPWFTAAGDGSARGDDLLEGKCYYATGPSDFTYDEVPIGQQTLADFRDARGLGCVVNHTHHGRIHRAITGAFALIATTPRDPLFWAYHKYASGIDAVRGGVGTAAAAEPESLLTAWERQQAAGPPGLTGVFPPRGMPVARVPGIAVFFWEPVSGVTPGALTVNGAPAKTVVGSGAGPYVFGGFTVPPAPGPGGSTTLQIALASSTIVDGGGTPFPGERWALALEPDQDGDDVPDGQDNCPALANDQTNTDALTGAHNGYHENNVGVGLGDALGDACDPDDDGDGVSDADELAGGSDPLDWRDPYPCPLDPAKRTSGPGVCGCGIREHIQGDGSTACFFADTTCTTPGQSCDDGDACTTDACTEPAGCTGAALPDFPNLACRIARLGDASICEEPLQKKVAKLLAQHAKLGGRLATKAGDTTKETKRRKLLGKLQKLLGRLVKKVDAAQRRGKVGEACAFTVAEQVAAVQALIAPLVP